MSWPEAFATIATLATVYCEFMAWLDRNRPPPPPAPLQLETRDPLTPKMVAQRQAEKVMSDVATHMISATMMVDRHGGTWRLQDGFWTVQEGSDYGRL